MLEVELRFDFRCCSCGNAMGVTLQCAGPGVVPGQPKSAAVPAPCPTCGGNNLITFTTDGRLHTVRPDRPRLLIPQPSYN